MDSNAPIDWEDIFLKLTAFAGSMSKGKAWFRGGDTTSFFQGKEAKDYALEAIEKYINEPEKYDPSRGELIAYLEFNLIRSQIRNDVRKKENQTMADVFGHEEGDMFSEDDNGSYLDRVLPYTSALFDENFDYNAVKEYIEREIAGDTVVENVFLGLYVESMKRREIIEEFQMPENEYNNGVRRLNTVLERAALHFKQ